MVQEINKSATNKLMFSNIDAQDRVVIERVTPELDGGRFPVKAIAGDVVVVEADIFSNGCDKLVARLRYRHTSEPGWQEVPMAFISHDRWGASFTVERPGRYLYSIEAWVNPLASWQHAIRTRIAEGQRVTPELLTGANYVDWLAQKARGDEKKELKTIARLFRRANRYDEAIEWAQSQQLMMYSDRYAERLYASHTAEYVVDAARSKAAFSTWYSLAPQSASQEPDQRGTFRRIEGLLPRIADMGFDVLSLMAIRPLNLEGEQDENSAGFSYGIGSQPDAYSGVWSQLGTLDDFKHLVAIAQNYDMEVALDLQLPSADYADMGLINCEMVNLGTTWQRLVQVLLTWASWGVRIIRVDNPQTRPFAFWQEAIAEVKKQHPDMLFLAAAITDLKISQQLAKRGFDQSYTYYAWCNSKYALQQYLLELTQSEMSDYFRPNFWPATPDINPYCLQRGHEAEFMIRYFLAATLSSNCGIYGPAFELMEHAAVPGKEEFLHSEKDESRQWDWGRTNKLMYLISLINRIRRDNSALQLTNNVSFCRIDDDALMAYLKVADNNRLLLVVNTDAYNRRAGMVQVPILELGIASWQEYVVHDLLTGAQYTWKGEWNYVELDPYLLPMHLLKIEA